MSTWHEINDPDEVGYDAYDETINVMLDPDDFGNNYVSIPLEYIIDILKRHGFEITKSL